MSTQSYSDISSVHSKLGLGASVPTQNVSLFTTNFYGGLRQQGSVATEQLTSKGAFLPEKFEDRFNNNEFTPIIPQLESYTADHILFIDNRPIHLVRFLPYYDNTTNQTLYTIQYMYLNERDHISFQLTVTKNGYGYSSSGRKYEFKCIKKEEYYCV